MSGIEVLGKYDSHGHVVLGASGGSHLDSRNIAPGDQFSVTFTAAEGNYFSIHP